MKTASENETMLERLKLLEDNIRELSDFKKKNSLKDIQSDKSREWALRYGFVETIQVVIDISCYLVSKYNLGNPSTYSECIDLLQKYGHIDEDIKRKVLGMVGLRNILIHEYISVDVKKLYALLDNVQDLKDFINHIKDL